MNKKRWEIVREHPSGFVLSPDEVSISFDSIVNDGIFWQLYKGKYNVARLGVRTNEVVNFDDYCDWQL